MLYLGIAFSSILLVIGWGELIWGISSFAILVFLAISSVKFNLAHPIAWFSISMLIYSLSAPILMALGVYPYINWGGWDMSNVDFFFPVFMSYIALISFLVFAKSPVINFKPLLSRGVFPFAVVKKIFTPIIIIICVVASIELYTSGIVSKKEFISEGLFFFKLSFVYYMLIVLFSIDVFKKIKHDQSFKNIIFFGFFIFTILIIVSGQRNMLLRFAIVIFFLYITLIKPVGFWKLLAIVIAVLSFNAFSQFLKPGVLFDTNVFATNIFISFLSGEFMTASNNLVMIYENFHLLESYSGMHNFIFDIIRGFIPAILFGKEVITGSSLLYNSIFFPNVLESGGGVGYSLVGSGFFYFQYTGIVFLFSALGYLLKTLYTRAGSTVNSFIIYINIIPIIVFSLRFDVGMIVSQTVKNILLLLVFIHLFNYLLKQGKNES